MTDNWPRLRAAARLAALTGIVGTIAFLLHAGQRTPRFLLLIMAVWVLSPYAILAVLDRYAARASATRAALYGVTMFVAATSLVVYGADAVRPLAARSAVPYVLVPPVSWAFIAIVLTAAALRSSGRILKTLALLIVAGIVVLVVSISIERRTEFTLPAPTGESAVGRVIADWVDDRAVDALAPVPGTKREVLVWIWYPAPPTGPKTTSDYVPAEVRAPSDLPGGFAIMRWLTRDLSKVHSHGSKDAAMSPQPSSYPVLILRGGASAGVMNYTTLAEDLASHGYVVVGIDAPYRTGLTVFPDGRVITQTPENNPELYVGDKQTARLNEIFAAWVADITFVVDRLERLNASDPSGRFTGRLDLTRLGVFGHSFGGAQAAQFCHDDARCKAVVDVDGAPFGSVIQSGLKQPFMFLLSGHGDPKDADSREILANIQSIYDRLPTDSRLRVEIRGANHFLFGDDVALMKSRVLLGALRLTGVVGIDGPRQLAVTAYCLRTFFNVHLRGSGQLPLNLSSPLYPEIHVLN